VRRTAAILTLLVTLLYPFVIWLWHGQVEPRSLAVLLVFAALLRLPSLRVSPPARWCLGGMLLLVSAAVWANALLPLKLYPVLVNAALLGAFGYSLIFPPSMVERFARMREPDLPPLAIHYTYRVTQIWCGFFVLNGIIALITALWASPTTWSVYNGLVAYLLMGLLFAGEYAVRRRFKQRPYG
jgi:uncharacterized membrane protein